MSDWNKIESLGDERALLYHRSQGAVVGYAKDYTAHDLMGWQSLPREDPHESKDNYDLAAEMEAAFNGEIVNILTFPAWLEIKRRLSLDVADLEHAELGARLKDIRLAKGYTQRRMAQLVGISQTTLGCFERGLPMDYRGTTITSVKKWLSGGSYE